MDISRFLLGILLSPEDGVSTYLRNFVELLPDYTASHHVFIANAVRMVRDPDSNTRELVHYPEAVVICAS
jgi:hypothetical protein